eukprot:TRINITY_DN94714_c0_g1_i1.p1 TRINITY_DN94714_c0_g1~~TRINITY_DN94714_c0_g1_i1.p1  ORF type:complete len:524 (+),score=113.96 TRINITY_DN94714_c0_g1_i1:25-1572(+)
MATADEIRAQIAAARQQLEQQQLLEANSEREIMEANTRQQLRRELDVINARLRESEHNTRVNEIYRNEVDLDNHGYYVPATETGAAVASDTRRNSCAAVPDFNQDGEQVSFCEAVSSGEYQWAIKGMSWLKQALVQHDKQWIDAPSGRYFQVGDEEFDFLYRPDHEVYTLAIRWCGSVKERLNFRYKVFIRRSDGSFLQWGSQGNVCLTGKEDSMAQNMFGPDVRRDGLPAVGVFGLSHEELLQSEWVQEDTLTVKFQLEVRAPSWPKPSASAATSAMSASGPRALAPSLLSMLEEGKWSDVTFIVRGASIKAHSQVLSSRSEVFERLLFGGMQESVSREVVIEDCEPIVFKALLQFLYSDDLSHIEKIKQGTEMNASPTPAENCNGGEAQPSSQTPVLQDVLSLSHRYQIPRVMHWCEQQLCKCIAVGDVCSILCQAHLYDAKQLEEGCLKFIKENIETIISTDGFARLASEWPEVLLKISLSGLNVSSSKAASALLMQQASLRKRKRGDDDTS